MRPFIASLLIGHGHRIAMVVSIFLCTATLAAAPLQEKSDPAQPVTKRIWLEVKDELREIVGEVILEGQDGGFLLISSDGRLTVAEAKSLKRSEDAKEPMMPATQDQLGAALLEQMPKGSKFNIHKTKHFVICYDTTEAYAKWTGTLYEKIYAGFYNFWKEKKLKLDEPRFPLVSLVFQTKASYLEYATPEIGRTAESMFGYYNLLSNRVTTFDLTGTEGLIPDGVRVNQVELLNTIMSKPEAERTIATLVHETIHQLSYNSGLQVRLADNPKWVSEGLAVFFETPDGRSTNGWGKIGVVNKHNLRNYLQYKTRRPVNSLVQLLSDDSRFTNPAQLQDAYAECWALNYFLLKKKPKEYVEYLKLLSELDPLGNTDGKQRVVDFQKFFGNDLDGLDREFQKFISLTPVK